MTKRPLRKAFFRKLRVKLLKALKQTPYFEGWKTSELYMLSRSIVEDKKDEIIQYLETNEITLKTAERAIEEILEKILVPEIFNIKI